MKIEKDVQITIIICLSFLVLVCGLSYISMISIELFYWIGGSILALIIVAALSLGIANYEFLRDFRKKFKKKK